MYLRDYSSSSKMKETNRSSVLTRSPGGHIKLIDLAVDLGDEGGFHFHGFHDHQGLVDLNLVALLHQDGFHRAGNGGAQVAGVVLVGLEFPVLQNLQGLISTFSSRRIPLTSKVSTR